MSKILIVDDSKFGRRLIVTALQKADHEVTEAADGEQALSALRSFKPDCIITDLLMPVLDGPGWLTKYRDAGNTTPVIVISADIQESTRTLCESLGVSGFLNKPFKAEELTEYIDKALGQSAEV